MDKQKCFDIAASALLKQGAKSMDPAGCAYRGAVGLKCAVGHLIPDELYKPQWENRTIWTLVVAKEDLGPLIGSPDEKELKFLTAMQGIHDGHDVSEWPERLISLAKSYGLDPSSVLNALDKQSEVC